MRSRSTMLFFLIAVLSITAINPAMAQKNKKKKKYRKKDIPALLKKIENYEEEIQELKDQNTALESDVDRLSDENYDLKAQMKKMAEEAAKTADADVDNTGVTFKVQLGAYQKFDASAAFNQAKRLGTEKVSGTNKYVIGNFSTFEEARKFEDDLKRMGLSDAWLVPYNNGQRISDTQAEQLLGFPIRDE